MTKRMDHYLSRATGSLHCRPCGKVKKVAGGKTTGDEDRGLLRQGFICRRCAEGKSDDELQALYQKHYKLRAPQPQPYPRPQLFTRT